MPKTYVYQSNGVNSITYAEVLNPDSTVKVDVARSWVDSAQDLRFVRRKLTTFSPIWVKKPGCADGCLTKKSSEAMSTTINSPMPMDQTEKDALVTRVKEHFNNVLKALDDYNAAGGSLPPAAAVFDGTYTS